LLIMAFTLYTTNKFLHYLGLKIGDSRVHVASFAYTSKVNVLGAIEGSITATRMDIRPTATQRRLKQILGVYFL